MINSFCANCRFAERIDSLPDVMWECRRRAPRLGLKVHPLPDVAIREPAWPVVAGSDWCGEHQREGLPG